MNKLRLKRRWQILWRGTVCSCLLLTSGSVKAQTTSSSASPTTLAPRCTGESGAVKGFQTPGQPWQIGISQLMLSAIPNSIAPDMINLFPMDNGPAPFSSFAPGNVDLYIVDDFSYLPIEAQVPNSPPRSINLSHGYLVIAHLRALLESVHYNLILPTQPEALSYRSDSGTGSRVITLLIDPTRSANAPEDGSHSALFSFSPQPITNSSNFIGPFQGSGIIQDFSLQPPQVPGVANPFPNPIDIPGFPVPPTPRPIPSGGNTLPGTIPIPTIPGQPSNPGLLRGPLPGLSFPTTIVPLPNLDLSLRNYFSRPVDFTMPNDPGFTPTLPLIPSNTRDPSPQPSPNITKAPNSIVNMSLSIFNCEMLERIGEYSQSHQAITKFHEIIAAFAKDENLPENEIYKNLSYAPSNSDFMYRLSEILKDNGNSSTHALAVAASGNYGLPASTAPASLSNVISVGARTQDWKQALSVENSRYWSDSADVVTVGVGFTLTKDQMQRYCREGGTCVTITDEDIPVFYENFNYSGTSFAAPSISAFLATRIGNNDCFNDAGIQGFKPLDGQKKFQKLVFAGNWIHQSCETTILKPLRLPYTPPQ